MRDLDVVRIAAETRDLRLELRVVALAGLDIRIDDKDDFTPARAERFAAAARSCLDKNWMPLAERGTVNGPRERK